MTAVVAANSVFKPMTLRLHNATFVLFRVTVTGNYVALGDPLDLSPLYRYGGIQQLRHVIFFGKAGFVYQWDAVNKKFMVFVNTAGGVNTALGEHTAVAYVAGILADEIYGLAIFAPGL